MPVDWDALILEHARVTKAILAAVNSPHPEIPVPSIRVIALQRSRAMIEAYRQLVEERNLVVASALIRMQLDSLMRVYACELVDNPMDLWSALETDDPWRTIKLMEGKPLTDAYLREQLAAKHDWASDLYVRMSGYVHLGRPHLDAVITGKPFLGMTMTVGPAGQCVTEEEVTENTGHMLRVTLALLHECRQG